MSKLRLVLFALVAMALAMGFTACGDEEDDDGSTTAEITGGEETLDLVIGDSLPLSGGLSDFGPAGEKAADIAIDEINSAIEEAGVDHTVSIVHEDNCGGDDQQCAVQAARKLVDSEGASCIAGAWASADTIPTAESVAIPDEVLLISPASTSDEITGLDDDGLVNRTSPPDSFQGPTLANFMDEELGGAEGKTVNIGARNDAYGTGLVDTFSAAWEELGGEIGEEVVYDIKLPNYDTEAEQLTSGNPDATVIFDFPETYNKVGPALVRAGFDPNTTFFTDGLISGDLAESAGEDAVNGVRGTAPGVPDDDTSSQAFADLFADSEPKDVETATFDAQNFDAVMLCYLAAVAAGSTEGADMAEVVQTVSSAPGDEYTWEELPEAIEALQNGDDIDYQGASGAIDMDSAGDATGGVYDVFEFTDGAPEPIDEVDVLTDAG
jgi:ABC-type branched-subunit amino acid transport system substrate-binding protein